MHSSPNPQRQELSDFPPWLRDAWFDPEDEKQSSTLLKRSARPGRQKAGTRRDQRLGKWNRRSHERQATSRKGRAHHLGAAARLRERKRGTEMRRKAPEAQPLA